MENALFKVVDVRKQYQMGEVLVPALRDVSLEVREGEFLVVLGPSGSGKSTLLNILGGLDAPTSGRVLFRNEALDQYTENQRTQYRRHHIGFVFQFYNLMPNLTAEENVEMAAEICAKAMKASEALRLVNLTERSTHFPSQLSGGEQQRVAIARAVAKQPEVLLCDEPTGALDFTTGKIVLQVLDDINASMGTTVIVITHNAVIGDMAHRVIHMKDGCIHEIKENRERKRADHLEW